MHDPVSNVPDSCAKCGSQVGFPGFLLCDRCAKALPSTGAKQPDPGLQTDGWSLHQQQFGGPHAHRKPVKPRFDLDPKDVVIEVTYMNHSHSVRVYLRHKPTDCFCQEEGPDVQKEAIHSRLWGKLKGMVEARQGEQMTAEKPSSLMPVSIHLGLHPATRQLVARFAEAMAGKLYAAQQKYGYSDGWADPSFIHECRTHLWEHLRKGDPRDVANYCAFLWWHNASTVEPVVEARTVPEPQPAAMSPQVWQAVEELVSAFELLVVEELYGTYLYAEKMALAVKVRNLIGEKAPTRPDDFGQQVTKLIDGIRKAKTSAWRDSLVEELIELIEPSPGTPEQEAPEQPSSQVHPDSALPSRRSEPPDPRPAFNPLDAGQTRDASKLKGGPRR